MILRRALSSVLTLALTAAVVAPTLAAPKRAPGKRNGSPASLALDAEKEAAARAHFTNAEAAYKLGEYKEALDGYQAAYATLPLPAFLFNIGQCHRGLAQREKAIDHYQKYLTAEPTAPNRWLVEDLIAEQQRLLDVSDIADAKLAEVKAAERRADPRPLEAATPTLVAPGARLDADATLPDRSAKKVWQRWWFWGTVGGAVLAGVVTAVALGGSDPKRSSLGVIDGR